MKFLALFVSFCWASSIDNGRASQIEPNIDPNEGMNLVKLPKRDLLQAYLKTNIINYLKKNILQEDVADMDQEMLVALKAALQDVTLYTEDLIQKHPSSRTTTESGTTVGYNKLTLAQAITSGDLKAVRYRAAAGDSLTARRRNGNSPIHIAAAYGEISILQYFVEEARVHVDSENIYGYSPLHLAAFYSEIEAMKYLVGKGANVSGGHNSVLHYAALSRDLEPVKYLIKSGADINQRDTGGNTVLHYAALTNYFPVIKFLVEHGADVNVRNHMDSTPLHFACMRNELAEGNIDDLKYLFQKGADLKVQDNSGRTPLHYASYNNRFESIKFLIENGAEVNAKDSNFDTPLHRMASNYLTFHKGAMKYLVEHAADVGARNNENETPWLKGYLASPASEYLTDPALQF